MRRRITNSPASSLLGVVGGIVALVIAMNWTSGFGGFFPQSELFVLALCFIAIAHIFVGLFNTFARPEDRIGGSEIVDIDESIYCKHCGKKIPADSTYCKFCGGQQ